MNKIKSARQLKGMKSCDVAKAIGVTPGAMSKVENGIIVLRPAKAQKLADLLGMPLTDVLFSEADEQAAA